MYLLLLGQILFTVLHLSYSWDLPPAQFLTQFAMEHDRSSITLYIPTGMSTKLINDHRKAIARYIFMSKYKMHTV